MAAAGWCDLGMYAARSGCRFVARQATAGHPRRLRRHRAACRAGSPRTSVSRATRTAALVIVRRVVRGSPGRLAVRRRPRHPWGTRRQRPDARSLGSRWGAGHGSAARRGAPHRVHRRPPPQARTHTHPAAATPGGLPGAASWDMSLSRRPPAPAAPAGPPAPRPVDKGLAEQLPCVRTYCYIKVRAE